MRIEIEIPKEFEEHFNQDKFEDSLNRLYADVHLLAGNYERELAEMLIKAFRESKPAYDIDKVVEELEEKKADMNFCEYRDAFIDAIEIVKQVVDGFVKTIENQTCEGYEHGRILTNAEANQWNEYRQLDEQGLLLRLPCGIGADVYFIPSKTNYKLNILQGYPESNRAYHQNVEKITFTPNGWYLECDKDIEYATDHILVDKLYKETWFLTQAEAEQKLKEMESD